MKNAHISGVFVKNVLILLIPWENGYESEETIKDWPVHGKTITAFCVSLDRCSKVSIFTHNLPSHLFIGRNPPPAVAAFAPPQEPPTVGTAGVEHPEVPASAARTFQAPLLGRLFGFGLLCHQRLPL